MTKTELPPERNSQADTVARRSPSPGAGPRVDHSKASDDDPSGIATYSQAGAQFGLNMGWVMLVSWPLMCAIQEISAHIGRVTGRGIAGNLKQHYPRWILSILVLLLLVANTINLGVDLGAMAAALKLVIGGPQGLCGALRGGLDPCWRSSRAACSNT